jgi:hypothetical protein
VLHGVSNAFLTCQIFNCGDLDSGSTDGMINKKGIEI